MYSSFPYFLLNLSILFLFHVSSSLPSVHTDNFHTKFDITWGNGHGRISNSGQLLSLSLDKESGSGFQSKDRYLFGKLDMQIKLVPGNSAGTVTTFYLSSQGSNHDEIDFEFLGNLSGDPYILHTNVFTRGKGNREQQFYLWFDPTKDFHTYSILWNPQHVIFYVDGIPIRDFKNLDRYNVDFPRNEPMRLYSSIWDGEEWATRGGLVKTDWSKAPFVALYRNFESSACVWTYGKSRCASMESWFNQQLDVTGAKKLKWVQENYMIYNYCTDRKRGIPAECVHM